MAEFRQTRPLVVAAGAPSAAPAATQRCCDLMEQSHWTSRVFCLTRAAAARVVLARRRRRQCAPGLRGRSTRGGQSQRVYLPGVYLPGGEGHFDVLLRVDPGDLPPEVDRGGASGGTAAAPGVVAAPMLHLACRVATYVMHFSLPLHRAEMSPAVAAQASALVSALGPESPSNSPATASAATACASSSVSSSS